MKLNELFVLSISCLTLVSCSNKKDDFSNDKNAQLLLSGNKGGSIKLYSNEILLDEFDDLEFSKSYEFKKGTEINVKVSQSEGFFINSINYNEEKVKIDGQFYTFILGEDINKLDIGFSLIETNIDDFSFEFNEENKEAYITNYSSNNTPSPLIIPDEINGYKVTKIKETAFDNTSIKRIKLGNNINNIEDGAFKNASTLTYFITDNNPIYKAIDGILYNSDQTTLISVPSKYENSELRINSNTKFINDYALYTNRTIKNVIFNDSLEKIGKYAFYNVNSIEELTFPSSLITIDDYAFKQNTVLKTINFNQNLQYINSNVFYGCIKIRKLVFPNSLKEIGNDAFYHCDYLSDIKFNEGLVKIGDRTFSNLTSLINIEFPSTLKSIGSSSFSACSNLKTINLNNIETIGNYAFVLCNSINKINIPKTIKSIGFNPFYGILHLDASTFTIEENNNYIINDGVLFSKDKTKLISYPYGIKNTNYIIPSSVTILDNQCFAFNNSLASIELPTSVTKIDEAFYGVTSPLVINYNGTIEEFNLINKEGSNGYSYYEGSNIKKINCTNGTINL